MSFDTNKIWFCLHLNIVASISCSSRFFTCAVVQTLREHSQAVPQRVSGSGLRLACSTVCVCGEKEEESSWGAEYHTYVREHMCPCTCARARAVVLEPSHPFTLDRASLLIPPFRHSKIHNKQNSQVKRLRKTILCWWEQDWTFYPRFSASRRDQTRHVAHLPGAASRCGRVFSGWENAEWRSWKADPECQGWAAQVSVHLQAFLKWCFHFLIESRDSFFFQHVPRLPTSYWLKDVSSFLNNTSTIINLLFSCSSAVSMVECFIGGQNWRLLRLIFVSRMPNLFTAWSRHKL